MSRQAGLPASDRVRVRRSHERGRYDRETIFQILDAGVHCHVGFTFNDEPVVIPTLYWRDGERLYFHGSNASRMMCSVEGRRVCIAVTHLDGLVLAHSAFHHSANYRSVTVFGVAEQVGDPEERARQLKAMTERLFPGRWDRLRPPLPRELKATRVLSVSLAEASAKLRSGPPDEEVEDHAWPVWAGVIPIRTVACEAIPDEHSVGGGHAPPAFSLLGARAKDTAGRE